MCISPRRRLSSYQLIPSSLAKAQSSRRRDIYMKTFAVFAPLREKWKGNER